MPLLMAPSCAGNVAYLTAPKEPVAPLLDRTLGPLPNATLSCSAKEKHDARGAGQG